MWSYDKNFTLCFKYNVIIDITDRYFLSAKIFIGTY